MKKPKRSFEWQEDDVSSKEDMDFALDAEGPEEIIELEDVLDMAEEPDDLEEPDDADAGTLDADAELAEFDLKDLDLEFDADEESFLEGDLSEGFSLNGENAAKPAPASAQDIDALLSGKSGKSGKKPAPPEDFDDLLLASLEEKPLVTAPPKEMAEPVADSTLQAKEPAPSVDELVAQIEDRLLEAVRQIVESRLPDIVRTVLREEIDRLQQEMEQEKA